MNNIGAVSGVLVSIVSIKGISNFT